ncbi:sigma 54-interacting transcriptional regulator [uncultured Propionivibrio sp.]|uniref:sigma 54-interacting transcriptional regulator n=1 Tax=uncultured Propionivibrio sp. TaxID=426737 RepID=UPI0029C0C7CA|nr:sigma 54-interacting transcriptional regulator [uncultured Propionivibrio sp.]
MKEIVVIAPYAAMVDVTARVIETHGHTSVSLIEANMDNAVAKAHEAIQQGGKVIISRGGLFDLIKANVPVPVVGVKVTAFDLIESFSALPPADLEETIGVIGFKNVIAGAEKIAKAMRLSISHVELRHKDEIELEVLRQIGSGIRVFLGDGDVGSVVKRNDCTFSLVHSGSEAVQDAIIQAKEILNALKQQKEKAQQFATIIDFVHDGIIAVDASGVITVFNSASEKLTHFSKQEAIGRKITEVVPEVRLLNVLETVRPEIGDIQQLENDTVVATNRVPVIVDGEVLGAVATYQDITEVQKLEQKIRIKLSQKGFMAQYRLSDIIHASSIMATCIRTAEKFSHYDTSVLITGPSGAGKELFAQGIHNNSKRKNSPFVAINCAALPETLIESELFGYVEGSFTGATKKGKPGLFEMAHGGTIFLDEISELPLLLQGRLLRVLQEKEVMRIGDNKMIPVDVRIICASNRSLINLVNQKQFRSDLYFRISTLRLKIPPLSQRADDIELLSSYFLKVYSSKYKKGALAISSEALSYLKAYVFKGNVRELQGMIERAVVISESPTIEIDDFDASSYSDDYDMMDADDGVHFLPEGHTLKDIESEYIEYVYRRANGSVKDASEILGIGRSTLWRHIKEKNIRPVW